MNEKIPDILLTYPSGFPEEHMKYEFSQIHVEGINIKIKQEDPEPYCSFEWIVPTIFGAYLFKPYFESFLSEAGKDHYQILKKGIKTIIKKGKVIKSELIAAETSTEKLSGKYDQSGSVSLIIQTKNNKQLKLLFDESLTLNDWEDAIDQILDYSIENYENFPNDQLTKNIESLNKEKQPNYIYALINTETKKIEFFDDKKLANKYK